MTTFRELSAFLDRTLGVELPLLRAIVDGPATARPNRPSGRGWSQREELGHLIDSAVNNHVRFARAALEPAVLARDYDQDGWVRVNRHNERPWPALVDAWHVRNLDIVHLVAALPDDRRDVPCTIGTHAPVALAALVDSYVLHMQHHLDQIHRRAVVTQYPRAAEPPVV